MTTALVLPGFELPEAVDHPARYSTPIVARHVAGIYAIIHTTSGRCYVGQSRDLAKRWTNHRQDLAAIRHDNSHLQRAWIKYGPEAFDFRVLERCAVDDLDVAEQRWIDALEPAFNIERRIWPVHEMSPETRAKLSAANKGQVPWLKGRTVPPEIRARISAAGRGRHPSPEARARMSAAAKRRPPEHYLKRGPRPPEARARMSAAAKRRGILPATRAAQIIAMTGRPRTPEEKAKLSASLTGGKRSPEARARMSAAQLKRREAERRARADGEAIIRARKERGTR